jgi:hypothetical protein
MKEIPLTQGKVALVDDEDFEYLNQWKWYSDRHPNLCYASRRVPLEQGKQTSIGMHRQILGLLHGDKRQVDHINHNGLDNQRHNLRICSCSENQGNQRLNKKNTSGYKGVVFDKRKKMWRANIKHGGHRITIGYFHFPIDAAKTYDAKAKELRGEHVCLNFPDSAQPASSKGSQSL